MPGQATELFQTTATAITWCGDGETLRVEAWGRDSIRIRSALGPIKDTEWALLPPEADAHAVHIAVDGDRATLTNGAIVVALTARSGTDAQAGYLRHSCRLRIEDRSGRLLFEEVGAGGALKVRARDYHPLPGGSWRTLLQLRSDPAEVLYGMGQYQDALGDLKGSTLELAHRNSQASIPFVMSSAGYGMLWHTPAVGRATFGTNRTEWEARVADQIDYWVSAGQPAQVAARYAEVTGHVPMMPEYGLGFWQSTLRYASQDELLEVAREFARLELPLDVIVADFFHWPELGDYRFEEEFWPDPRAMVAELRELGVELMVSVWPQVSPASSNYDELSRHGHLVRSERGVDVQMAFGGPSRFLDTTHPGARDFLDRALTEGYRQYGIDLFWLDEAEPEFAFYDYDAYHMHAGPVSQVGGIYPQSFVRAIADGRRRRGQDAGVSLVRCAWAGSQRHGALVWSGDIASTWSALRAQIAAGIHIGVAGIPWFTTDIGGFGGGRVDDPDFVELLLRWFQLGTFLPVMRLHGDRGPGRKVQAADGTRRMHSGAPNQPWSYGPDALEVMTTYLRVRERLRPYLRKVMAAAHTDGQPVMRGLFHEFPGDRQAWHTPDQFLLGPDLLVAPVTDPGRTTRRLYLPEGAQWTSLHTGTRHDGGTWVDEPAPLEVIPVFRRDGALAKLHLG
ncbi:glycoside hydrolase family 31 protein [Ruania albidiflava]|uniref:glycoside hydrolase family 31 protein n=2 Tax=Ruania albidiflava TaxID=366586 RepID=UPI0003B70BF7|nr:TIM-barrel domain-containing protein [Ruania albidiflava]